MAKRIACILLAVITVSLLCSCARNAAGGSPNGGDVLTASEENMPMEQRLAGKKVAVQTGTVQDQLAAVHLPDSRLEYYNTSTDLAVALDVGKVNAYLADEPVACAMMVQYPSHRILDLLTKEDYAFIMPRSNPGSEALRQQLNEFLSKCRTDGTLAQLREIWIGTDRSRQVVDMTGLTGENGTLTMATTTAVGVPFTYIQDNTFAGHDIDLAVRFCREYGYALRIMDFDPAGLFTCVSAGKCDFGAACVAVTEERKETMLFSDPYYEGGIAVVVKDGASAGEKTDFFASVGESFEKTFIREDRYKLFLHGLGTTLIVVLLSILFGTALGFGIYTLYYRSGKMFRGIVNVLDRINEFTPVVVILMILYYVVFGKTEISSMWVSVIGFSVLFAGSVIRVMKIGVGAVESGQREAALALGYTEGETFVQFILPQAARHFLPDYKSAIVQLIKESSIVGYIAVQDLTKVSDIVRSRTYEAFFPLIVTALIYFLIAALFSALIRRIEIRVDPHRRKKERILRGVKRK